MIPSPQGSPSWGIRPLWLCPGSCFLLPHCWLCSWMQLNFPPPPHVPTLTPLALVPWWLFGRSNSYSLLHANSCPAQVGLLTLRMQSSFRAQSADFIQREFWCGANHQTRCATVIPQLQLHIQGVCIRVEEQRWGQCKEVTLSIVGAARRVAAEPVRPAEPRGSTEAHSQEFSRQTDMSWEWPSGCKVQWLILKRQIMGGYVCMELSLVRGRKNWQQKVNLKTAPTRFKWLWEARLCAVYFREKSHCPHEMSASERGYSLKMLIWNTRCGWDPIW